MFALDFLRFHVISIDSYDVLGFRQNSNDVTRIPLSFSQKPEHGSEATRVKSLDLFCCITLDSYETLRIPLNYFELVAIQSIPTQSSRDVRAARLAARVSR